MVAWLLLAPGIRWGLPGWQTWAVDAIHPVDVERAVSRGFTDGWHQRYPPFHYYLLAGLYAADDALAGDEEQPRRDDLTRKILLGRGLSLAMTLGTLVLLGLVGRRLFGPVAGVLAVALAVGQPSLVYYAKTTNLEAPYLFWFVLSLFFFVRLLQEGRRFDALALGAAAALAVGTKDQAYAFYALAPIPILAAAWTRRGAAGETEQSQGEPGRWWPRLMASRLMESQLLWATLAGGAVLAAVYLVPGNWSGFWAHVELITGSASKPYRQFPPTLGGYASLALLVLRQIAFCAGWGGLLAGVGGALFAWRQRHDPSRPSATVLVGLAVLCLSYELTFIAVVGYSFLRFQLPVALVLALFGGLLLSQLLSPCEVGPRAGRWSGGLAERGGRWLGGALVVGVVAFGLLRAVSINFQMLHDQRYQAERWVEARAEEVGASADEAVCIGRLRHCPRLGVVKWGKVLSAPQDFLDGRRPRWIVLNVSDLRGEPERSFHRELGAGRYSYRLVLQTRSEAPLDLLQTAGLRTSFRFLNPRIDVFERIEDPVERP